MKLSKSEHRTMLMVFLILKVSSSLNGYPSGTLPQSVLFINNTAVWYNYLEIINEQWNNEQEIKNCIKKATPTFKRMNAFFKIYNLSLYRTKVKPLRWCLFRSPLWCRILNVRWHHSLDVFSRCSCIGKF